jgi:hypothetical protein
MITWLTRLFFGTKPRGPAHVYAPRGSVLETYYGTHACLHCGRFDQDEPTFTDPPCPREFQELA